MPQNENNLTYVELATKIPPKRSVIWLHGLGADGHDFVPIVQELHLDENLGIRFIFPHAPIMPVAINNNYEMRAWFNLYSLSFESQVDQAGIMKSVEGLKELIQQEQNRGIASENILLAGFSQGAVIALTTGITFPEPLAGIIALSTYLPFAQEVIVNNTANQQIPIFMAHGTEDPLLPYELGEMSYEVLKQAGFPITWHSYPMPHSVCPEEIKDLRNWLIKLFKQEHA